jgi:hypothetical protein
MNAKFSFVVVLASIITALGLGAILKGVGWIVTCRHNVRIYSLHLIGATLVFLLQIEFWWGTFSKNKLVEWNFFSFLVYLLTPICYYLVAELLFPSRASPKIDFRKHYWDNFRWFYGIAAAVQLNNIAVDALMPTGSPSLLIENTIRIGAFTFLMVMVLVKSPRVHACLYAILSALFVVYVMMFSLT